MLLFPLGALLFSPCAPNKKRPPTRPIPYITVTSHPAKDGFSLVALRETKTGRTLWKGRVYGHAPAYSDWSKNHRSLLLDIGGQLLVWRIGTPLLQIDYVHVPGSDRTDRYDYLMDSSWSPDGRRLLVSFGLSGMGGMGYSRMFSLTFKGTHYKYTVLPYPAYVRDMGWRSNTLAFYKSAKALVVKPPVNPASGASPDDQTR